MSVVDLLARPAVRLRHASKGCEVAHAAPGDAAVPA
jgi:hypothetical protein